MLFQNEKEKIFHFFLVGSEQSDFPTIVLYRLTITLWKKNTLQKKYKIFLQPV